jgi:apolipoprotein N-acyltransferase
LGYSQHLNLPFIQSSDLLGAYGLSFALVLVNVTLYLIIRQWSTRRFP